MEYVLEMRLKSIQPGEFRDVDAPGGNIKDAFMPLPFKEPSATLLQLMGTWFRQGKDLPPSLTCKVGDGNQQAAVGNDYSSVRARLQSHVSHT